MNAGQRTIEQTFSGSFRRGGTFEALGVALGISNASLRRWARSTKRDGSSKITGARFIRGRWVLLGKLTAKRVESIRSGLNLHQHLPPAPKKWKWKSKEERLQMLDKKILAAWVAHDEIQLPSPIAVFFLNRGDPREKVTNYGRAISPERSLEYQEQERRRLIAMALELKREKLALGKRHLDGELNQEGVTEYLESEKTKARAVKEKQGSGYVKKHQRGVRYR